VSLLKRTTICERAFYSHVYILLYVLVVVNKMKRLTLAPPFFSREAAARLRKEKKNIIQKTFLRSALATYELKISCSPHFFHNDDVGGRRSSFFFAAVLLRVAAPSCVCCLLFILWTRNTHNIKTGKNRRERRVGYSSVDVCSRTPPIFPTTCCAVCCGR
jgi:hypothetical protein